MRLAHNTCQTASDLSRRGVLAIATRDAKWSREQSDSRNRLLSALISNLGSRPIVRRESFENRRKKRQISPCHISWYCALFSRTRLLTVPEGECPDQKSGVLFKHFTSYDREFPALVKGSKYRR